MALLYWLTGALALVCAIWLWFTPSPRSMITAMVASMAVVIFAWVAFIS